MAMFAMLPAPFAARPLGVVFGRSLGKGGGLPLGRALGRVETLLEVTQGLVQLADETVAFRKLLAELLDFRLECLHRETVHADLDDEQNTSAAVDFGDCHHCWQEGAKQARPRRAR